MVVLDKTQIKNLINMDEATIAMEKAFVQLSNGKAVVPKRLHTKVPGSDSTHLVMPAYAPDSPNYIVKTVSVNRLNPQRGLPLIHSTIQVFDSDKGQIIATLDGESITAIRTGATSGLATKTLANKEPGVGAIFGTGVQAQHQVEALVVAVGIKTFLVFSRSIESAQSFCNLIQKMFGIEATTGKLEQLKKANVICTATPSEKPLFDFEDISPGVHINAVGSYKPEMQEVGSGVVRNARVIVDSLEPCKAEAGDLIVPAKEGEWSLDMICGELGQAIQNKTVGRQRKSDVTLFKSVGNAIQDLVLVNLIMEKVHSD